jgi:hypothetical protein
MKHKPRYIPNAPRKLPADAQRVLHPVLGIKCWQIGVEYYRSRADYPKHPLKIVSLA